MSEEDIRHFLSSRKPTPPTPRPRMVARRPQAVAPDSYKNFQASHLFCPSCKKAMPVREKLLLVLPGGDLYDYLCTGCGKSLGTRRT